MTWPTTTRQRGETQELAIGHYIRFKFTDKSGPADATLIANHTADEVLQLAPDAIVTFSGGKPVRASVVQDDLRGLREEYLAALARESVRTP